MTVKELIARLQAFNPEATVDVIAHNRGYRFSLCWGDSDGCTKANCRTMSFYVDELCGGERVSGSALSTQPAIAWETK